MLDHLKRLAGDRLDLARRASRLDQADDRILAQTVNRWRLLEAQLQKLTLDGIDQSEAGELLSAPRGDFKPCGKKFEPFDVHAEFYVFGSGQEHATAVMERGASAVEAVEIASKFNVYTGGTITSVSVDEISNIIKIRPKPAKIRRSLAA